MDYKKAYGANLCFLIVVIVAMIMASGAAAAAAAAAVVVVVVDVVAIDFCNSGDFVIANVISNLP
jgi:hypothetical protein